MHDMYPWKPDFIIFNTLHATLATGISVHNDFSVLATFSIS